MVDFMKSIKNLISKKEADNKKDNPVDTQKDDLIKGYTFSADLKITTPLKTLLCHGDFYSEPPENKIPKEEYSKGLWVAKTKTYKEIGIPINELSTDTQASDIGNIETEKYLPFLKDFRTIVESDRPIEDQLIKIQELENYSESYRYIFKCLQKTYPGFPESYYCDQLAQMNGVGQKTAKNLFEAGYLTPEEVIKASDKSLMKVTGIGKSTINKIKDKN